MLVKNKTFEKITTDLNCQQNSMNPIERFQFCATLKHAFEIQIFVLDARHMQFIFVSLFSIFISCFSALLNPQSNKNRSIWFKYYQLTGSNGMILIGMSVGEKKIFWSFLSHLSVTEGN